MSTKPIRVGIADDDELMRQVLIRAIEKSADLCVVAAVENGKQAVQLATSGQIDVLVLDVEMPVMTGAQALPIIRCRAPEVSVVMHSSRCSQEASREYLAAGAVACLEKPCDLARLVHVIRAASKATYSHPAGS